MFCFPNTGYVIILYGSVSFTFRLIQVHEKYLGIIHKKTMDQVPLGLLLEKQNIQAKEVYRQSL